MRFWFDGICAGCQFICRYIVKDGFGAVKKEPQDSFLNFENDKTVPGKELFLSVHPLKSFRMAVPGYQLAVFRRIRDAVEDHNVFVQEYAHDCIGHHAKADCCDIGGGEVGRMVASPCIEK